MAKQYYSVLTDYGTQVIAGAIASKQPLQITQMAVGDGNGRATTPNSRNTGLVREVHRADISAISVDPRNDKQIIFELTIPENVGGFWIREMGIFDNQNHLVAYANCPDSFKPQLESGSGKVQVVRMILLVSSSDAITLKVDDSVIFVTRGQLTPKAITATTKNAVDETGHSHEIDKATTSQAGIVTLDSSINSKAEDKAATPKAVKTAYDKAKAADDNANTRVSKSGGEMAGGLKLKSNYSTSEKQWDYSGFYAGSVALNGEDLPYFQIHISPYSGNGAARSKSLGFDSIGYKAYVMSWNSSGEYAGKKEILTELHRSDSVTSTSSDTVATSKAVKTAYDKAVDGVNKANAAQAAANNANNNANNRVSKEGDTVVGTIYLKRGSKKYRINNFDWSLLLEIDSNLDSLIGNNRCAIGFNSSGSLGLGGNAVDGWWAGINKSGLSVAKEITEGLTGKKLSESLPISWLVGMPFAYPLSSVPAGFLAMQGQAFDKSRYPILAQRYPNGRLPDMRGEFIRGWDNGRGADSGRTLLSSQDDAFQDHYHALPTSNGNDIKTDAGISHVILDNNTSRMPLGSFYDVNNTGYAKGNNTGINSANITRTYSILPDLFRPGQSDKGLLVPKATPKETRPRNIAFQYICLAA
ncbi:phage tail protein [Gallibacterium anatis]|uniref:phage tail-collar fiber domain-containing protein n=1 Tax=Gallibacterium anatis TaxID=750 RepID=UPI00254D3837|nr:phage tail protein [Gallibacterium anatis]WIM82822.1 phage tail protein [Gallibacterium anatis]